MAENNNQMEENNNQNESNPPVSNPQSDQQTGNDQQNDRVIAALAYLLFFLPLVVNPENEFGKFHANQGLNLLIAALLVNAIGSILIVVLIGLIILPLGNLALVVLAILGIVNALNGEQKELPVIGKYRLIK